MAEESSDLCLNISTVPKKKARNSRAKEDVEDKSFTDTSSELTNFNSKVFKPPDSGQTAIKYSNKKLSRSNYSKDETQTKSVKKNKLDNVNEQKSGSNVKSSKKSSLFSFNPDIPQVAHRAVKPILESVFSSDDFSDLKIHPFMVKNLKDTFNLTKMTVVQQKAIPVLLEGKDALVRSQTGSGKTLAFAIPVMQMLQQVRPKINRTEGVQVLVIVPTRELALQIYEIFDKLSKSFKWLVPGYLVGGERGKAEKARIRKGISILIATPGRLVYHVKNTTSLKFNKVRCLILDEADLLFDMGYEKDVAFLISKVKEHCAPLLKPEYIEESKSKTMQTILLSATLTPAVKRLAGLNLNEPVFVDASDDQEKFTQSVPVFTNAEPDESMVLPQTLVQKYITVPAKLRLVALTAYILWKCKMTKQKKMLVFLATQDMVDYHTELLSTGLSLTNEDGSDDEDDGARAADKIDFFKLHGNMQQKDRTEVFRNFRSIDSGVLLCTDVASRGLDLPHVDCVIQYTGPTSTKDYVHRAGRTARSGEAGSSLLFLLPTEVGFINMLEDSRIRLQEEPLIPSLNVLFKLNSSTGSMESAATKYQMIYENIVAEQKRIHDLACKAYLSWIRFYTSYPKNMRKCFNRKLLHLGHFAKSFALREPPSALGVYGRKIGTNEKSQKRFKTRPEEDKKPHSSFGKRKFSTLLTSEYDSGLEPRKKKSK